MGKKSKLIFMGTPEFSASILNDLVQQGTYEICAVYTQPPRKSGRGHKVTKSSVQICAEIHGLPVQTPASFKGKSEKDLFAGFEADIAVVVAYGLILPLEILTAPKHGCVNIHASLLPRWRGAAPIQHALIAGDATTGISLMKMDQGLDTGPVYREESLVISREETAVCFFLKDPLLTGKFASPSVFRLSESRGR